MVLKQIPNKDVWNKRGLLEPPKLAMEIVL